MFGLCCVDVKKKASSRPACFLTGEIIFFLKSSATCATKYLWNSASLESESAVPLDVFSLEFHTFYKLSSLASKSMHPSESMSPISWLASDPNMSRRKAVRYSDEIPNERSFLLQSSTT